jgi:hypothetical protein
LAQALIVVPASVASAQGEAPTVQVEAMMPGMTMPTEQITVAGPPQRLQGSAVYMAPVVVSMPGAWAVHVTVRASGSPAWQDTVVFRARAGSWAELPLSTQSAGASGLCMASPPVAEAPYGPPGATLAQQPSEQARRAGQGLTW